ncbi:MAG: decaprenyl-phosphate phosphoribosyltransferase [Candidatus Omnitrophota bacterium]|nr:decaprenyl-phosphate phosphoribosyltransferase [Candidatus Omnitrophota bacterium]
MFLNEEQNRNRGKGLEAKMVVRFGQEFREAWISMRPHQWTKNLLIFIGLIFSGKGTRLEDVATSTQAFIIFCLGASSIYILNDILDREQDKNHPLKKMRAIASGRLSVPFALGFAVVLFICSIFGSVFFLNRAFSLVLITYLFLMILYLYVLKSMVILDIMTVAIGFVLRAAAGAAVLNVEISPWLMICTLFLALFILMTKRRQEVYILKENASAHRSTLVEYSLPFLDQLVAVVTSSAVISYSMYTYSEDTIERLGTHLMPLTIPFVLYGIFRYLYLTYQRRLGGAPEELFISDRALRINIFLFIFVSIIILYFT